MKLKVVLACAGLGVATAFTAAPVLAANPTATLARPKKQVTQVSLTAPAKVDKKIRLSPRGLKWRLSPAAVSNLYKRVLDRQYLKLFRKVPAGSPRERALEAELKDKKKLLMRRHLVLGNRVVGADPQIVQEYQYNNRESYTWLRLRSGKKRFFFFIKNGLYKVVDFHGLRPGGRYGGDYKEAVAIMTKRLGATPQVVESDYSKGQTFPEARWITANNIVIRLIDLSFHKKIGLAYVDGRVFKSRRKLANKGLKDESRIDTDVANATRKAPPKKPKVEDKKRKKKRGRR